MLKKIFSKKNKEEKLSERESAISDFSKVCEKWNFDDIRDYLRGVKDKEVTDIGLASILTRFNTALTEDKKATDGKRKEFELYDRVERTKKGLDIFLSIANHVKLGPDTLSLLQDFSTIFEDVIVDFDQQLSQTYEHKIKEAYKTASLRSIAKSKIEQTLNIKNF